MALWKIPWYIPGFGGESVRTHALTPKSGPLSRQGLENHFDGFPDEDDFVLKYEMTIRKVLGFLDLDAAGVEVPGSHFAQLADDKVEERSQRFQLPITI